MHALLLAVFLAAPSPAPVVWRFADDHGPAIRDAVLAARGENLPHHLIAESSILEHLRSVRWPASLGCLDDSATCRDPRQGALPLLGLSGSVEASAKPRGEGFEVTLRLSLVDGEPQAFVGRGPDLEMAAVKAWVALRGHGTIRVEAPEGSVVFVDDQAVGEGPGEYPVAPGKHVVKVDAKGKRPVEQSISVAAGEKKSLRFELADSWGRLALNYAPATAKAWIDGEPWQTPDEERELKPGDHVLRLEAEGYDPTEHPFTIKSATRLDLTIGLQRSEPEWQKLLRAPHPDTQAHPYYVRAGLRLGSVQSGKAEAAAGSGADRIGLDTQDESSALFGIEAAIGWRSELWTFEPLGLGYQGGGEAAGVTFEDGERGRMRDLSRFNLRLATFGVRYPAWRLEPYAAAGLVLASESFSVEPDDEEKKTQDFSRRLFFLGLDIGVRYHLTGELFGSVALNTDVWSNERAAVALVLSVAYALDLPEWL